MDKKALKERRGVLRVTENVRKTAADRIDRGTSKGTALFVGFRIGKSSHSGGILPRIGGGGQA